LTELSHGLGIFWSTHPQSIGLFDYRSQPDKHYFIIYSGGGYPNYLEVIEAGVDDVSSNEHIDRLVIAVDSEELSYDENRLEIDEFIKSLGKCLDYKIIVQHFCLETWALGNQAIVSRGPKDMQLRKYREYFDVLNNDPELLPEYPEDKLSRAQFAERYLGKLLNEKYRNLSYRKSNPGTLLHKKYYERLKMRLEKTGHIPSFNDFLCAFV